jgi:hypothetical protein
MAYSNAVNEPRRSSVWPALRRLLSEGTSAADSGRAPGQQEFVDTVPATYLAQGLRHLRPHDGALSGPD